MFNYMLSDVLIVNCSIVITLLYNKHRNKHTYEHIKQLKS